MTFTVFILVVIIFLLAVTNFKVKEYWIFIFGYFSGIIISLL